MSKYFSRKNVNIINQILLEVYMDNREVIIYQLKIFHLNKLYHAFKSLFIKKNVNKNEFIPDHLYILSNDLYRHQLSLLLYYYLPKFE